MKTELIRIIVTEPGKGKAVNPYFGITCKYEYTPHFCGTDDISKGDCLCSLRDDFEADSPIRDCIDTKGNALQPREQPYECKEVWQFYLPDLKEWVVPATSKDLQTCIEQEYKSEKAYQLIEDAVKGEKEKPKSRDGSDANDDWATPKWLYDELNAEFNFDFDPCPLHADFDGLAIEWGKSNFVNPPYNREDKPKFIQKAFEEWQKGKTCVLLIPAATGTKQFHELILPNAQIRFLKGRVAFAGYNDKGIYTDKNKGKHDSMIVIFRGKESTPVNEAKAVMFTRDLSAYQYFRENAGDKFDGNVWYKGTIDHVVTLMEGYANYRATHPIENKEGVKSVEESAIWKLYRYIEDKHFAQTEKEHLSIKAQNKYQEEYWMACEAATEAKNLFQFTPIEQGKRMVDVEQVCKLIESYDISGKHYLIKKIKNLNKA